ncbi:MAG: hypothetical protein KDA66_19415, partial [Planctomycetaceae bacterium]|nr:hypothetical protein [Planctomycetaceae bacterium]
VKHEVPESDPGYEIAVITAAFHYVWQNVGEDAQQRVLTPYEVFIYGRGTPPDRIWCFAELARQLACDTVLIAPKQAEQPLPPLVGVLTTRDELLLFEPSLGIPLADLSATPTGLLPNTPATLKEVLETPDFFKNYQFAAVEKMGLGEFAYPIKHEHLKSVEILIAGHPSQWAPRMASVEFRTPSDQEALFYTGLGQNSLRQNGAYDRVVGVGAKNGWWAANDVQVWLDPLALDIRLEQDRNSPATSAANWQQMNRIMQGPEVVNATGNGIELAQRSLEDVRIEQLTGKSATALSHLLAIRNANQQYKSDINAYAADFATFRTAQCQMDIGQWPAATQTLLGYLNVSSGHQLWTKEAVEHLAWIQMQELEIAPPEAEVNPLAPFIVFRQLPEISYRQLFQLHYWARVLQASGRLGGLENASPTGSGDASSGRPPSPPLPTPLAE